MKIVRQLLSEDQVIEPLGNWVAFQHDLEPQTATAQVFFVYEIRPPQHIRVKQARVELTLQDADQP